MSLRYRLNLMLVVTVLIMLVAGSLLVGFNARRSVATEIESSVLLASSDRVGNGAGGCIGRFVSALA